MITAIRDVRKARGLTLEQVARACVPPTTAQQIGRLETGTRTVSLVWLNRIAAALGVTAADLVALPDRVDLPVVALLDARGARAPAKAATIAPVSPLSGSVAIRIASGVGDYRTGDVLWCETLPPEQFAQAIDRDVLAPRAAGGFAFGRLLACGDDRLELLAPDPGARRQPVPVPPWIARATRLIRDL